MARRTRTRTEEPVDTPDEEQAEAVEAPDEGGQEPKSVPGTQPGEENPEQPDTPLVTGKGGRYVMENGRRVLRTD